MEQTQQPSTQPIPQPTITPPAAPPVSDTPSNLSKILPWGIVIISLVAVGFLSYQNYQLSNQLSSLTATSTPTSTPVNDPTSNWQTYTSQASGFSFKYPSQLQEVSSNEASVSGPLSVKPTFVTTFADKSTIMPGTDAPFDGFSIYSQDFSLVKSGSFTDYLASERNDIVQSPGPEGSQTATIKTVTLGQNVFSYIDTEHSITRYFIQSPDKKRVIIFSQIQKSTDFSKTFDQILSTFKFTGGTAQTCVNKSLGISATLPDSTWECVNVEGGHSTNISSDRFYITLSSLGRGEYCAPPETDPSSPRYSPNQDPQSCVITPFMTNESISTKLYTSYGKDKEIYGETTSKPLVLISITFKNEGITKFTDSDKTILKSFLQSIKKI